MDSRTAAGYRLDLYVHLLASRLRAMFQEELGKTWEELAIWRSTLHERFLPVSVSIVYFQLSIPGE